MYTLAPALKYLHERLGSQPRSSALHSCQEIFIVAVENTPIEKRASFLEKGVSTHSGLNIPWLGGTTAHVLKKSLYKQAVRKRLRSRGKNMALTKIMVLMIADPIVAACVG